MLRTPDVDLALLPTFIAFAEHQSFTHAALSVHLSQPAVHLHVARLQEQLGAPLYRRRGRALELTDAGRELLAFARDIASRKQVFLATRGAPDDAPVVLCAGAGAYLYLLGPGIQRFRAHATVPLRLLTRDRAATVEALRSGEAHLGVTTLDEVPSGLSATPLIEVAQVLAVPSGHRLARKRVRLADLDGEHLVVPPLDRPQRTALATALRDVSWHVAVEATGWDLVLHFVALGLGVAVVNACCRIPEGVVTRPLPELPRMTYHLLQRTPLGGHARALAAALVHP